MKPREYPLMESCVEQGARIGYERAHKHTSTPTKEQMVEAILRAVMCEIQERWVLDDELEE